MSLHTNAGLVTAGLPVEVCKSWMVGRLMSTGARLHPELTLPWSSSTCHMSSLSITYVRRTQSYLRRYI
jgi:hypothetical protein